MTWEERPAAAGAEAERARGRPRPPQERAPRGGAGSVLLRALLLAIDTLALGGAWLVMAAVAGKQATPAAVGVVAFAVGGLWLFRAFGLYKTSVCMLRSVELARVARATVVLALAAMAAQAMLGEEARVEEGIVLAAVALLLAGTGRSAYRVWVSGRRRVGDFRRPVVIVGANEEAAELITLVDSHPELGFKIAGVVGSRTDAGRTGLSRRWIGDDHELFDALASVGASGTIVCATALEPARLNATVQKLLAAGVHVQLSSGLRGVQIQRLRPMPLAYEPLFYVEPADLGQWQLITKRVLDVVLSLGVLVVAAPILLVTSVLVRLTSPGPVIFRQERIGLGGEPFTVFKFRTMRVGADQEHHELRMLNSREGPLFKAEVDPRVTRLGKYLRSTGIDELPQLFNVLNGTMSLVGPRPALPDEVAEFDDELRMRETVRPGITGLWQVEARDNPSFSEYRRFDLFYIDNWSVSLDLVILWSTVEATLTRTFRALRDSDADVHLAPAVDGEAFEGVASSPVSMTPRLNGLRLTPAYATGERPGHTSSTRRSKRTSSSSAVR